MLIVEFHKLQALAQSLNLAIVGVTSLAPLEDEREHLESWQKSGFSGEMSYMARSAELLTNPLGLMPEGRTVLSFALGYDQRPRGTLRAGFGRVARYAWGRDYHRVLKKKLGIFVERLTREIGAAFSFRIFSDAVPLLERALAERAGIGFVGKNTMLIRPRTGSLFFIAEILADIQVSGYENTGQVAGRCGNCMQCISKCPTQAFVEPYRLDARRCISYLTIEKEGPFSEWEREALGEWVFGCDVCQEVCPFNHTPLRIGKSPALTEFSAERGAGESLDLAQLLAIRDDEQFRQRFGGTPLMRPGRAGLLRNAAVVAANTGAENVVPALFESCAADPAGVVRQHALWALCTLAKRCNSFSADKIKEVLTRALSDPDPLVVAEAKHYEI